MPTGQKLDGANRYTLRFAPGQLPPVNAFWSLTMYELPQSLLVANPINRYLINSPMLPQFKRDADGGVTLLIQNESPGKDKEANWLPAPKGPFVDVHAPLLAERGSDGRQVESAAAAARRIVFGCRCPLRVNDGLAARGRCLYLSAVPQKRPKWCVEPNAAMSQ